MKLNKIVWILSFMFLISLSFVSAVPTAPDSTDVVAYWKLEDLTDSVASFDLTNNGATSGATGIINDAYTFDGSSYLYRTSNLLTAGTKTFTISGWFNLTNNGDANNDVFDFGDGTDNTLFNLRLNYPTAGSNDIALRGVNSGAVDSVSWSDNYYNDGFHHFVIVGDGTNLEVFIDSVSVGSTTITDGVPDVDQFVIGATYYTGSYVREFNGVLDEFTISDVAYSQDEIDYLYASGSPTYEQQYPYVVLGVDAFEYAFIARQEGTTTINSAGVNVTILADSFTHNESTPFYGDVVVQMYSTSNIDVDCHILANDVAVASEGRTNTGGTYGSLTLSMPLGNLTDGFNELELLCEKGAGSYVDILGVNGIGHIQGGNTTFYVDTITNTSLTLNNESLRTDNITVPFNSTVVIEWGNGLTNNGADQDIVTQIVTSEGNCGVFTRNVASGNAGSTGGGCAFPVTEGDDFTAGLYVNATNIDMVHSPRLKFLTSPVGYSVLTSQSIGTTPVKVANFTLNNTGAYDYLYLKSGISVSDSGQEINFYFVTNGTNTSPVAKTAGSEEQVLITQDLVDAENGFITVELYAYSDSGTVDIQGGDFLAYLTEDFPSDGADFTVTAYNLHDNSSINNFNVTVGGTVIDSDSGVATVFSLDPLINFTIKSTGYVDKIVLNHNSSLAYNASMSETRVLFKPYKLLLNTYLDPLNYSANYTIDGVTKNSSEYFYLSAGEHTVLAEIKDHYSLNFTFNVSAEFDDYVDVTGVYDSVFNLNLVDIVTSSLLLNNSYVNLSLASNSSYWSYHNNTNGSFSIPFIKETFNIYAYADGYAFRNSSVVIDETVENLNLGLYTNNSIWVTAVDFNDGQSLNNFSVEIYNDNFTYTENDNNTGTARFDYIMSGVYIVRVLKDGYSVGEYSLTMTGGSHQNLIAYLVTSGSETIFTVVDSISGGIIEGATASMYKTIGGNWTLVSSQLTDITGRVKYAYIPNIEYRFIIDKDGYEQRLFFLKPLFDSYTVRLTPDVDSIADVNVGDYVYEISNSGIFYDDQVNNFSISISSGTGTIEYYYMNVTAPDGNVTEISCFVANGCSNSLSLNITGAEFNESVVVEYWIKESGRSEKYFRKPYPVIGVSKNLDPEDDVDDLGKAFLVTIICLIVVGVVSLASVAVGAPPITVSGFMLGVLVEVFAFVNWIPDLAGHIVALGCLLIVLFGRGEI